MTNNIGRADVLVRPDASSALEVRPSLFSLSKTFRLSSRAQATHWVVRVAASMHTRRAAQPARFLATLGMTTLRRGLLTIALLLAGCSFFSRTQNKIFSLDRIAPTAATDVRGTPIGIESLELPPGFDRREIVVRRADHQLDVRSNELWSASLQPLILHTLAYDLAARLPEGMVILPGEIKPAAGRTIDVVIEDIAAGPDAHVVLDAHWIQANVSHREHIAVDIPSLDSVNVATGTSQAVAALADRITAQLR